jgi:FkbM family methyltransferase
MTPILDHDEIASFVGACRRDAKRIAFAIGSFDLLHDDYLVMIEAAASGSDATIVGILDDITVRLLFGPGRPACGQAERARVVAALTGVDIVTIVDGETVGQLLRRIRPDVLLQGTSDDWLGSIEVLTVVKELGGRVNRLAVDPETTTAALIESIRLGVDAAGAHPERSIAADSPAEHDGDGDIAAFSDANAPYRDGEVASRVFTFRGVEPGDYILSEMRRYDTFYEGDFLESLPHTVPSGGVIIDAGAHIGNHSVYFGTFLASLVIAIEPVPEHLAVLEQNLMANGVENAIVVRAAVGRRDGAGFVARRTGSGSNSGSTQVRLLPSDDQLSVAGPVRVTTIDAIVEEYTSLIGERPISLIKLDIEGHELAAIYGAIGTIGRHHPHILVELTTDATYAGVVRVLDRFGYRAMRRSGGTRPTYHFVPRESAPVSGGTVVQPPA